MAEGGASTRAAAGVRGGGEVPAAGEERGPTPAVRRRFNSFNSFNSNY